MRRMVRIAVPVVCLVAALSLLPAASASAATTTASCTKQVLLFPGTSASCSTGSLVCPPNFAGQCEYSGRTSVTAAVGLSVGGTVRSSSSATLGGVTLAQQVDSATCSAALALLAGCTGQTARTTYVGSTGLNISGQGSCIWTGGPVAVLATLSCTESMTARPAT